MASTFTAEYREAHASEDPRQYFISTSPNAKVAHILRSHGPETVTGFIRYRQHHEWAYCGRDLSSDRYTEVLLVNVPALCGRCASGYFNDEDAD